MPGKAENESPRFSNGALADLPIDLEELKTRPGAARRLFEEVGLYFHARESLLRLQQLIYIAQLRSALGIESDTYPVRPDEGQ